MPERAGPHPLAILLPGCLSWHPHHDTWRDDLLGRGYAVLHADSFSQRGLIGRAMLEREVCSGFKLQGDLRAGDLVAVLGSLHARDNLDLAQTVIFGWSHGGWTAMEFLMRLTAVQPQRGAPSSPASISAPRFFTILTAVQDRGRAPAVTRKTHARCCSTVPATSSPIPASVARGRALAKSGAAIEFVPLNDAPHWFDNHAERTAYDVGATARAKAAMDEVLDLWLVDQRSKDRLGWRAVGQVEK